MVEAGFVQRFLEIKAPNPKLSYRARIHVTLLRGRAGDFGPSSL